MLVRKCFVSPADSFLKAGDVLLKFRNRITHPNPERAVLFGLLTVGTILEVRALEDISMWHELLPISDEEIEAELTRSLLGYLRAAQLREIAQGAVDGR